MGQLLERQVHCRWLEKTVLFPRSDSLGGVLRKTLVFLPRSPLATYLGAFLEDF